MKLPQAEAFIRAVCEAAGDEEVESRIADLHTTAQRIDAGENVTAWGKAGETLGKAPVKRVRGWLGEDPASNRPGLARIVVNNRQMREVSDDIVAEMEQHNDPPRLMVRGGQLIRIRDDENGRPLIELLDEARLLAIVNRMADFVAVNKEGGVHAANASHQVLRDVLVRGAWPYPALVGLTQCPVVRPDGGIVTALGYESSTRLVYVAQEGLVVPPVSNEPSRGEVSAAVDLIDELLRDFPFDGPASRANMIALLLEPLLRPAISPVPYPWP